MATNELTGATEEGLKSFRGKYYNTPLWLDHKVPFEVAYCLNKIARQPDDYDGPPRFCKRRAAKKDDYEGHRFDEEAYAVCCPKHGGEQTKNGDASRLDDPRTAAITTGMHAEDENLIMDFSETEQKLFDGIMEGWPEIYDWPPREEDPARYSMLRRVAVNEVRSRRAEDYLDDRGEFILEEVFNDAGEKAGEKERENPLAREYRLLVREITNQLSELGLTPKERQKMDTLESEEDHHDALTDVAGQALSDSDTEYDPTRFDDE